METRADITDKIELYQLHRGPWAPNVSPFAVKLETYLRIAKIPYKAFCGIKFSSRGKSPFLLINGKEVTDSQLAIDHCTQRYDADLNKDLSEEDLLKAHVYRIMIEENTFWAGVLWRYRYSLKSKLKNEFKFNAFFRFFAGRGMQKRADKQGLGLHSKDVVLRKLEQDLRSLSSFLGTKQYLLGDEPREVDCAIFGHLVQIYYNEQECPAYQLFTGELKNLGDYCDRIRDRFWPDWDDCITHGGTKKPIK